MKTIACGCDIDILKEAVRVGRAKMVCPKCKKDISLEYFLIYEALEGGKDEDDKGEKN